MANKFLSPLLIGQTKLSDSSGDLCINNKPIAPVETISISLSQVVKAGSDIYTTAKFIRFTPTQDQSAILSNNNNATIKLDLTDLGEAAPAQYVWIKRNTIVELPNPLDPSSTVPAIQFSCGGEQFWYNNYATDIAIKDIGNAALVYVPSLNIADITMLSISVPNLYADLGRIPGYVHNITFSNITTLCNRTLLVTSNRPEEYTYDTFATDLMNGKILNIYDNYNKPTNLTRIIQLFNVYDMVPDEKVYSISALIQNSGQLEVVSAGFSIVSDVVTPI